MTAKERAWCILQIEKLGCVYEVDDQGNRLPGDAGYGDWSFSELEQLSDQELAKRVHRVRMLW